MSERTAVKFESQLKFPLPPLVRALYTEVGDGGYGPGYGVIELIRLVSGRIHMNQETSVEWKWPERMVEFVNWGCHYFSGIDCSKASCPVYFFNHDLGVGDITLTDCLKLEEDSLENWLEAWLDGEDLWKRGTHLGLHQ